MTNEKEMILNSNLIEINMHGSNRNEILAKLIQKLQNLNYVDNEFYNRVINREETFPTGLQFENIAIAIPHASPENVITSSIAVGICADAVPFGSMENPQELIDARIIIVLALNNPDMHLSLINRLMLIFQDSKKVERIVSAVNEEEVYLAFKEYLLG